MPYMSDMSMRPDDGAAFRQALRLAQRRSAVPLAFGGPVSGDTLHLTQHVGLRTTGLLGLSVHAATGLGGQVLVERRPTAVADYRSDESITHDYDAPVLAERISSVVAVPVVVSGAVRGVLYGATRDSASLAGRATDAVLDASRQLARELAVRDEVDRRLELARNSQAAPHRGRAAGTEDVREVHAELRRIAQLVDDEALRDRLLEASRRLAGPGAEQGPCAPMPPLSRRETDVLAQVALGCSNTEAASRLSLRPETVKAYLRSAMRKLDVHTRFEAVVVSRRNGILP